MKPIFEQVKELNIPYDSHATDLYVPVNDATRELIKGYEYRTNVTTFVSQIDKKLWFEIPFAYLPGWNK
jgi:hypothetical protein